MKIYEVRFKCYHYNTGSANNFTYTETIECETLEAAQEIRKNLIEQRTMSQKYEYSEISYPEYMAWSKSFGDKLFQVEDGFVSFSIYGELPQIFEVIETNPIEKQIQ